MSKRRTKDAGAHLRRDVLEAIDRLFPNGVVENAADPDEPSFFDEVHAKLTRAFRRISTAELLQEHEARPEPGGFNPDDDYAGDDYVFDIPPSRSYRSFFISPKGDDFRFEAEDEEVAEEEECDDEYDWGDDLDYHRSAGFGRTGWIVAASLLAPFAVIELQDSIAYEDGSWTEVEIESFAQTPEGELITDQVEHFRKHNSAGAYEALLKLRGKIAAVVEKHGITVLPEEEWRKPVLGCDSARIV